jgi:hypothetical protein
METAVFHLPHFTRKKGVFMSRYTFQKQRENNIMTIAYGYDHAMGYFYQEANADGELLVDLDSFFSKLTGVQLAERLCDGETQLIACLQDATVRPFAVNWQHVAAMMLDLPF